MCKSVFVFCIFWIDQEFVFFKTNKNSYNFYQFDGLIVSDQNIRGDEKMIFRKKNNILVPKNKLSNVLINDNVIIGYNYKRIIILKIFRRLFL